MSEPIQTVPIELRASEAATLSFVAIAHLEALHAVARELHDWALKASFAVAGQVLESQPPAGGNAFDNKALRMSADVVNGCMFLEQRFQEALNELRPINHNVQVREELATRASLRATTH